MLLASRIRDPGARRAGTPLTWMSGATPMTIAPRSAFCGNTRCTCAAAGAARQAKAVRAVAKRSMGGSGGAAERGEEAARAAVSTAIWWRFRDSNPGPADYDSVALTD